MSEGETTAWLPSPGIATVSYDTSVGLAVCGAALETPLCCTSCFQSRPSEQRGAPRSWLSLGSGLHFQRAPTPPCPAVPE